MSDVMLFILSSLLRITAVILIVLGMIDQNLVTVVAGGFLYLGETTDASS